MSTGSKRLLKLAAFLRTVPAKKFDMGVVTDIQDWHHNNRDVKKQLKDYDCGSAACAIGYCPLAFPRSWKFDGSTPMLTNGPKIFAFRSAEIFFELDYDESYELFTSSGYSTNNPTPKQVARKIEKFVRDKNNE